MLDWLGPHCVRAHDRRQRGRQRDRQALTGTLGSGQANLGTAVGLALAGLAVSFIGRRVNEPVAGFDPQAGQPVQNRNRHTLFFVPLQYIGPLAWIGSGILAIVLLAS